MKNKKIEYYLLLGSFLFLTILGVLLSYNYEIKNNYNLLFDSDTARVIGDATEIAAEHYRADVHPMFILFTQPLVLLLSGIVQNKMLAIIILSSLVSSLSVFFLYKILDRISPNKKLNLLFSGIYLFSFSNIIFTSGIETYNFAALFLIMMWYYFLRKQDENLNGFSYIILILFGILTFAYTITNVVVYLIMIFLLWISKKLNIKKIMIIGVITISLVLGLNIAQKLIWNNTPVLWNISMDNENNFVAKEKFGVNNFKNVFLNDYYNSWISSDIHMTFQYGTKYNGQNYIVNFEDLGVLNFLFITAFYILIVFLLIRNFKKNKLLNSGLILALLFNTILHLFYGNNSTFLYSLHFNYIILLLLGINLHKEQNKTWKKVGIIYTCLFLIIEVITNSYIFVKLLGFVKDVLNSNYLVANFGLPLTILFEIGIILVVGILLIAIYLSYQKLVRQKGMERKAVGFAVILLSIILIESIFINVVAIEKQNKFLIWDLKGNSGEIKPKEKKEYLPKDFQKEFEEELKELDSYKEEIELLKQEYETTSIKDTNWSDYYYFGMANRKKLVYRPGSLIDIETKEEIKTFEEKEHYIIPNTYTVLIKTTSDQYIKIKEDNTGIHYIVNGKDELLEGTNVELTLESFENQKYKNILKVLYGEILFNIKDSVIYPNIIVYNKPWYRDAAMTSMVLQKTNNTNLITDWVNKIEDLYDRQNAGEEEADNLGELLYILSTQEEKNYNLINRIEEEAERLARENPNGYYIYGKTDFGDQYLYQNLWYKLGIESVGRSYKYDLNSIPEDNYSRMAWWSNYEVKNKEPGDNSKEYPYLTYATRHKLGNGQIPLNENLYPLSWEIVASQANYEAYRGIDDYMAVAKVSPLHTWSASELFLLLWRD